MLNNSLENEPRSLKVKAFAVVNCMGRGEKPYHTQATETYYEDGSRFYECTEEVDGNCRLSTSSPKALCYLNHKPHLPGDHNPGWVEIPVVRTRVVAQTPIEWRYNPYSFKLFLNNNPISLTVIEGRLFTSLWKNFNQVLSHDTLYSRGWEDREKFMGNSVIQYMKRLRTKIQPLPDDYQAIQTHHGIGYSLSVRLGDKLFEATRSEL